MFLKYYNAAGSVGVSVYKLYYSPLLNANIYYKNIFTLL